MTDGAVVACEGLLAARHVEGGRNGAVWSRADFDLSIALAEVLR